MGLTGLALVLTFIALYFAHQNPVVITIDGEKTNYYMGGRRPIAISEYDIKIFIKGFIYSFNRWDQFSEDLLNKNVAPLITAGLKKKLSKLLKNGLAKSFKGKRVQQDVANIKIAVTKDHVVASFDKIMRVDNIPLILPTELSFQLIKGESTRWNELGLYVNGITEHKGASHR